MILFANFQNLSRVYMGYNVAREIISQIVQFIRAKIQTFPDPHLRVLLLLEIKRGT